jgi:hypothetical protein
VFFVADVPLYRFIRQRDVKSSAVVRASILKMHYT